MIFNKIKTKEKICLERTNIFWQALLHPVNGSSEYKALLSLISSTFKNFIILTKLKKVKLVRKACACSYPSFSFRIFMYSTWILS